MSVFPEQEGLTQYCSVGLETQAKNGAYESWSCPIQNEFDYLWTVGGYETFALKIENSGLNSIAFAICMQTCGLNTESIPIIVTLKIFPHTE